jgi:hypothetical protein
MLSSIESAGFDDFFSHDEPNDTMDDNDSERRSLLGQGSRSRLRMPVIFSCLVDY